MNYQWFRLYCEFATDPEVQILAFEDQRHFVMSMCMKAKGMLDKEYPSKEHRDRLIAMTLGLDRAACDEANRRLREAGLIDADWHPINWQKRQFQSDHDAAERMRKYRLRHRDVTKTSPLQKSDVLEQIQNRTDTDTEKEKNKRATRRQGKVSRTAPESFNLTAELRAWTLKTVPDYDIELELQAFRVCEFPRPYADWNRVWQRWVLRGKSNGRYHKIPEKDWSGVTKDGRPPQWM